MISVLKTSILRRKGEDKEQNRGDPFDAIPLKNMKCARETTEVHLGRRKIERLVNFEHFKNLEVLWINDNNLARIEGLDKNFRIKELYAHNNRIKTLEGSISKMRHLQTLSVYNNEISDLDKNIEFLSDFTYLEHLDIFNNPLSEEPYYKTKIIFSLKNLKLFDRHGVSYLDKQKAVKMFKSQKVSSRGRKRRRRAPKPHEAISKCESLLIKNANRILRENEIKEKRERDQAMGITQTQDITELGDPPLNDVMLNLSLEDEPPKNIVTEWEKTRFFEIFKSYKEANPSSKEICVKKENLYDVIVRMKKDEICLGKVPKISESEFLKLSEKYLQGEENLVINWNDFRKLLSDFEWRALEYQEVEGKINRIYEEAQELFHTDKHKECLDRVLDALKIEKHFIKKNERYTSTNKN